MARLKRENAKLAAGVAGGDGGFITADTTSEGLKIIGEENTKLREENDTLRTQVRQLQRELSRAAAGAASAGAASLRGSTELAGFVPAPAQAPSARKTFARSSRRSPPNFV